MIHSTSPWMVLLAGLKLLPKLSSLNRLDLLDLVDLDLLSMCSGVRNETDTLLFAMVVGLGSRFEVIDMAVLEVVFSSVPGVRVIFASLSSISRTSSFQPYFITGSVIGSDFIQWFQRKLLLSLLNNRSNFKSIHGKLQI